MSWLLLLDIMFVSGMYHELFIYSAIYRYFSGFQTESIINGAAVNILLVKIYLHFYGV